MPLLHTALRKPQECQASLPVIHSYTDYKPTAFLPREYFHRAGKKCRKNDQYFGHNSFTFLISRT